MLIRNATLKDAEAIARVHVESWQAAYDGLIAHEYLQSMSADERLPKWEQLIRECHATHHVLVVEEDQRILGFSHIRLRTELEELTGSWYELHAIYSVPAAWGRGIGSALLKESLSIQSNCVGCYLWTLEGNERAQHFYERHGFQRDTLRKQYRIGEEVHSICRYLKRVKRP